MWKDKQFRTDDDNFNESVIKHGEINSEGHSHYSVEPSNEKDYDIYLMTGNNNEKGSDKK